MAVDPRFWSGKTVLVTGHTGFKGSWLTLWLQALGARVVGFSLEPPTSPSLFELARVGHGIDSIHADVRDLSALERTIAHHDPEIVFHFAAQSLVRRSYEQPLTTYEVNVMGTANLLEAVRQADNVAVVVVATSDKCYANRSRTPRIETDPLGGDDPYSSSKACAEIVTAAYRQSFFGGTANRTGVASVRAGNVIGGGDWGADRLVPDLARALLTGKNVVIRNPASVRPWQHVLNPLSGYLALGEALWGSSRYTGAWNFGPAAADERPVEWVTERLGLLWGETPSFDRPHEEAPPEAPFLSLDSAKAARELGWAPTWDLERALESVVEWYRNYSAGIDPRASTLDQIERFAADIAA